MHHHRGYRNDVMFAAREQRRIFGQLSGIDLSGGDPPENVVGAGELVALAVLTTRQFHAGPHSVFLPVCDGVLGASPLLRQRAATQALEPRLGGRLLVSARLRRAVTTVIIGVAEP
ncbi:hypothetical protein A5736_14910 [Mycobacterium sp. SP-6446]|nr:hypothetical protein A5736_14910 [Mycobacterium sp. SP-6446]